MKNSPLLAIALVIGCATGAAVSQVASKPAHAEPTPARWEFTCRDGLESEDGKLDRVLKSFAEQRWELVTANQTVNAREQYRWAICFKRAIY